MKVTFPHMGNMHICIKALLEDLDIEVVLPPATSKQTLTKGIQYSPEFACLPLKVNLGNFMEAYELGADTILMAGGIGPCRFGYYAQIQREILKDLGYNYNVVVMDPPEKHISEFLAKIKDFTGNKSWLQIIKAIWFAYSKAWAVDQVELRLHRLWPREISKGSADRVFTEALNWIDQAKDRREVKSALEKALKAMDGVKADFSKDVLRVGIVGEIYLLLEPFVNLHLERTLGQMGVEVDRSIYLSQWISENLLLGLMKNKGRDAHGAAIPYINHFIGGHGQETIGSTVLYAEDGYDGVVQVLPFTCMPEIVAQSILPKVSHDKNIPTFTLIFDEHSGEAGVMTRLEAYVDLLERRRKNQQMEAVNR